MTEEAQRIAIAKICGILAGPTCKPSIEQLEAILASNDKTKVELLPNGEIRSVPDYLNDLNAMYEAEEIILTSAGGIDGLWTCYVDLLWEISGNAPHATPAQRSEAFLKIFEKWEI